MEMTCLIVEDDELDRRLLRRSLSDTSFEFHVFEAAHGAEALQFLADHYANKRRHGGLYPPIVVFLDINMPIMGGRAFLEEFERLRSSDRRQTSRVVLHSSSEVYEDRDLENAYEFIDAYLPKGNVTNRSLTEAVHACIAAA